MRGVPCNLDDAKLLAMRRAGKTYEDIALHNEVSVGTAWNAVHRARQAERHADAVRRGAVDKQPSFSLTPTYPINFAKDAPCPHNRPIRRGSKIYCEQCGQSGMDHHPLLQRSVFTDPKPERKPPAAPLTKPRKQGRKSKALAVA